MANSKIGQYLLEIGISGFTSPTRSHVVRLWVAPTGSPAPGTPPASVTIQKLGGATANLQVVADQFWSFVRLSYPSTVAATGFTLWKYVTENSRDFVTSGSLTTPAGTTGGSVAAGQVTLTFRCALGAIAKVVLLESTQGGDVQIASVPNALGSPIQRLVAYLMSADSPMIGLDNSFPVTPLRDSRGQNEAVWQKIYRA